MKRRLCFILSFLVGVAFSLKAEWQRPVTNYTRHAYKAGNQNWMLQQHENGWLYVANNKGLLEFDGTSWELYPIPDAKMRAMKIGADNRIYIGGIGRFGYFTPNRLGDWTIPAFRIICPAIRWLVLFGIFCRIRTKYISSQTVACFVGQMDGWTI